MMTLSPKPNSESQSPGKRLMISKPFNLNDVLRLRDGLKVLRSVPPEHTSNNDTRPNFQPTDWFMLSLN